MSRLGALLKYGDRRLMVLALVVVAGMALLYFTVSSSASSRASSARASQVQAEKELAALRAQVEQLQVSGAGDINQLISVIAAGEQAVPAQPDPIATTARVAELASRSGLVLTRFDASVQELQKYNSASLGILSPTAFEFEVSGSLAALDAFMSELWRDPAYLVTFESMSLQPVASDSAGVDPTGLSVNSSNLIMRGIVFVWGLNVPPVLEASVATPGDVAVPSAPAVPPADPAASAQPAPSGVVPQPAPSGVVPQPAPSGVVPQPAPSGVVPQPAPSGVVPQPAP